MQWWIADDGTTLYIKLNANATPQIRQLSLMVRGAIFFTLFINCLFFNILFRALDLLKQIHLHVVADYALSLSVTYVNSNMHL